MNRNVHFVCPSALAKRAISSITWALTFALWFLPALVQAQCNVAGLSFHEQPVGTASTPQSYVWTNDTNLPQSGPGRSIPIRSVTLNNPFYQPQCVESFTTDFATGGTCIAGAEVLPGGSCTVTIVFTPQATQRRTAQVTLRFDATTPDGDAVEIAVVGLGVPGNFQRPTVPVVEYTNASLKQYVVTSAPLEIAALDAGKVAGWVRTGAQFNGLAPDPRGEMDVIEVCRYFAATSTTSSHWYFWDNHPYCGVQAAQMYASSLVDYVLEDPTVFAVKMPGWWGGWCPYGTVPLYGLWDRIIGHRYTIDPAVRASMIAQDWVPEGFGADGVFGCVAS